MRKNTTMVVTSCQRYDLLQKTLSSFFLYNTYKGIAAILVIEDGEELPPENIRDYFSRLATWRGIEMLWVCTDNRVGQIRAIDSIYSLVRTPYIFHCEDDWEFYRPGFIEASMALLDRHPKCLQVWLREKDDTNGHPVEWGNDYGVLQHGYRGMWHGFSFNPGLRRLEQYKEIGSYGSVATFRREAPWEAEAAIGKFYHSRGYWAAILPQGYVKHIGDGRHVH